MIQFLAGGVSFLILFAAAVALSANADHKLTIKEGKQPGIKTIGK